MVVTVRGHGSQGEGSRGRASASGSRARGSHPQWIVAWASLGARRLGTSAAHPSAIGPVWWVLAPYGTRATRDPHEGLALQWHAEAAERGSETLVLADQQAQ